MKKYFIRAAKYFIYLSITWLLILSIMLATGYASFDAGNISEIFQTNNFGILLLIVFGFSAIYPKIGYVYKQVPKINDKKKLEDELYRIGIIKVKEEGNKTYYRYESFSRRLLVKFDDTIVIEFGDNYAIIDSNRVMASRIWTKIEYVTLN